MNSSLKCDKSATNHTLVKYISSSSSKKKSSKLEDKKSLIHNLASRNKEVQVNKNPYCK